MSLVVLSGVMVGLLLGAIYFLARKMQQNFDRQRKRDVGHFTRIEIGATVAQVLAHKHGNKDFRLFWDPTWGYWSAEIGIAYPREFEGQVRGEFYADSLSKIRAVQNLLERLKCAYPLTDLKAEAQRLPAAPATDVGER